MEWTVHPIKKNWKVSAGVIAFLVVLCAAIYLSFDSVAFLILSIAIFTLSLSRFFFPTTYILQEDCVVVKFLLSKLSRRWDYFKSYYPDRNGVLLSPFPEPSRLENFRGVYIRFSHNNSEVLDYISERMRPSPDRTDEDNDRWNP